MKRLAPLVLMALPLAAQSAVSVQITPSSDGALYSEWPNGDKPIGGGDTCLSGFTCEALGTATCQFEELSADSIRITATSDNDEVGICAARKSFASESDLHLEFTIDSIDGNQGTYAGGGAFVSDGDGDFSTPDYKSYAWWPLTGVMRFKSDVGGSGQQGQLGLTGQSLPRYGGFEYDATTNSQTAWESDDGVTWTKIGSSITNHEFNAGLRGFWATSYSETLASSITFSNIVENTTLSFEEDEEPPPEPGGLIFEAKFENEDWATDLGWGAGTSPTFNPNAGNSANNLTRQCGTSNGISPTDNCWLQIEIDSGSHYGSAAAIFLSELGDDPGYGATRYLSYDLQYGSTFDQTQSGKVPGWADQGGSCSAGGCSPTGFNGWSARAKWIDQPCAAPNQARKGFNGYIYYAEMGTEFGEGMNASSCNAAHSPGKGAWSKICYEVKMNSAPSGGTPKPADAHLKIYIGNVLRGSKTGIGLDWGGNNQIERVWMNVYHGGGQTAPQNLHVGFDNIRISATPISGYCGT